MSGRVYDVAVLGAGAAGMMCAFEAGRRGRRVVLLEHGERTGRKILISGGGRCNFTNIYANAGNFLSENPHFAKSALARFTPADMIALVEKHEVGYHEKTLGQLFCDESAQRIVSLLNRECAESGVEVRLGARVNGVRPRPVAHAAFEIQTNDGVVRAESVVVATGGLSIPKMGATGAGYDIARSLGHRVIEPRAALVPLVFSAEDRERWCDLTGVSTEVIAAADGVAARGRGGAEARFREKMLITQRGMSGPAILQISSFWAPGRALRLDLAPDREVFGELLHANARRDQAALLRALREVLPARLAQRWLETRGTRDVSNRGLRELENEVHDWKMVPAGTEGFAKAEVTAGGVDTRELDARTMQSARMPGMYFIGEVVDVTGWLGGYNFQWAWASAVACGRSV